ncbi:lipopolysaccharide assembly protein LapA domain-containing protein [Streptacidiphilus sp. MAP5-3]|uniref:lipopolysaccharide assembly protein LapA domain-containing protein n=1 Tax=unclassified Streptacidiphilus TaxID=2643834 RepID=UPI003511A9E5
MSTNGRPPDSSPPLLKVKGVPVRAKPVAVGLIAVAAVWFIAVNTETVKMTFWVVDISAPLWVVLLVTLLVGAVLGKFVSKRRASRKQ